MGGFEDIDEGIIAGERIENADIKAAAGIKPLKFEKRTLSMDIRLDGAQLSGASVAIAAVGVFPGITLPNANSGDITVTVEAPRGEMVKGERPTLHIWWNSAGTSGNARFVVDIKPAIEAVSGLSSAIQKSVISDVQGVASQLQEATIEFPPSIFGNSQLIGIKLARDPANTLDTLASDLQILGLYLTMNGRS